MPTTDLAVIEPTSDPMEKHREEIDRAFGDDIKRLLADIEDHVVNDVTLADLMREGSKVTEQAQGSFGGSGEACAMSAAAIAARARGLI